MRGTKEELNKALLAQYKTRKRDEYAAYKLGDHYFISDGASYVEQLAGHSPGKTVVYHLRVVKNEKLPFESIELALETVAVEITQ